MNCNNIKDAISYDIKGLSSNSASPTDTWTCVYKKDEIPFCKSFFKVWISGMDIFKNNRLGEIGLNYEVKVYEQIKKEIIDKDLSHSFVEIINFHENKTFEDTVDFVYNGLHNLERNKMIDTIKINKINEINVVTKLNTDYIVSEEDIKSQIKYNLIRNTSCYLSGYKPRPNIFEVGQINNNLVQDYQNLIIKNLHLIKYNYLETKNLDNSITFSKYIDDNIEESSTYKTDPIINNYKVFEQILIHVDTMNSKGIYHQDLHFGNILIDKTDNSINIFDFDRAYSEKLGDNKNLNPYCEKYGSCNEIITIKDFLKLFCGAYHNNLINFTQFKYIIFPENNYESEQFLNLYLRPYMSNCFLPRVSYLYLYNSREEMFKRYKKISEDIILDILYI